MDKDVKDVWDVCACAWYLDQMVCNMTYTSTYNEFFVYLHAHLYNRAMWLLSFYFLGVWKATSPYFFLLNHRSFKEVHWDHICISPIY